MPPASHNPARFTRHPGGWFLAPTAIVTGEVYIGRDVSFWYGTVVRGDVAPITIGGGTNVQDNATIHCDSGIPNHVGQRVTIGHAAVVHGARVGDGSLIGMSATLLMESEIGVECLVAAGAVVPPRMRVPDRTLVAGVPAKVIRDVTDRDLAYMRHLPPHYVRMATRSADDPWPFGGLPLEERP